MYWAIFIGLSVISIILGIERLWRFRDEPATLTHKTFLVVLFALGIAATAYGTMPLTASFYNIGLGTWHALVGVLLGALEMLVLVLRSERIERAAVRAVLWRSGIVTMVLVVTYLIGFAGYPPIQNLSESGPRNFAVILHMVVFPAYVIWGLMSIVHLCCQRLLQELRRRPINAFALLMVTAGCVGFIWINVVINLSFFAGFEVDLDRLYAPTPFYVGLWVAGFGLLAVGEPIYEELVSHCMLFRLRPLWIRVIQLMPEGSHLHVEHLPASARLQRAYVEISDAVCVLRVAGSDRLNTETVASKLFSGDVVEDSAASTLSQVLPHRRTRREDIELIHDLARAYRRCTRSSRQLAARSMSDLSIR